MPADAPKPDPLVISAFLDDVDGELEAATRLAQDPPVRFAAFHLQQAAEKLIKAVRLHRGLYPTADHNLATLVAALPEG
ncbi:MAG: HEPN domain-containing protein [Archangium sp.]|nr:HEPN domain-containing protein [Archangium sp.]MDP3576030.1 HEPN domain-containing protein [Archangium sp.]